MDRSWQSGLAGSPLPVAVVTVEGTIHRVNQAFAEVVGRPLDELRGTALDDVLTPPDGSAQATVPAFLAGGLDIGFSEHRQVRPDGTVGHVQAFMTVVRDWARRPLHLMVAIADVTEQRRQAEQFQTQSRLLERIARRDPLEEVLDGLCRSIEEQAPGTLCTVLLLNPDGRTVRHGAAPSMPAEFLQAVNGAEIGPEEGSCGAAMFRRVDVVAEDVDTHPYWVAWKRAALPLGLRACWSTPLLSADTRPADRRVLGSFAVYWTEPHSPTEDEKRLVRRVADITAIAIERDEAERTLTSASLTDSLTGLGNRRLFLTRLGEALARASADRPTVAVLYLDLDLFKVINDSMGHDIGDQLLRAVGARLQGVVRPGDTTARLGGDEFAIVCDNVTDLAAAEVLAERARRALAAPFAVAGREVFATASVGVSLGRATDSAERLVENADVAMYQAKARGRARVQLYDDDLRAQASTRLRIGTALRHAVERQELTLHYQPVIDLASGRLAALEALLRWESAELGPVPPMTFIPIAEETGMISEIGAWVVDEACRQYDEWRAAGAGPPVIAVNLSPRQLADPSLVATVESALLAHGVPMTALRFELTESALTDPATDRGVLAELSALGAELSVDDFGTGYSSLARLRSLAVHELKIDRSFVDGLGSEPGDSAVVAAIVRMAAELSLDVVAEGVETEVQLAELRRLGCPRVQGYLYARPALPTAFESRMGDHVWLPGDDVASG